jgi:hypothetical protein
MHDDGARIVLSPNAPRLFYMRRPLMNWLIPVHILMTVTAKM